MIFYLDMVPCPFIDLEDFFDFAPLPPYMVFASSMLYTSDLCRITWGAGSCRSLHASAPTPDTDL